MTAAGQILGPSAATLTKISRTSVACLEFKETGDLVKGKRDIFKSGEDGAWVGDQSALRAGKVGSPMERRSLLPQGRGSKLEMLPEWRSSATDRLLFGQSSLLGTMPNNDHVV